MRPMKPNLLITGFEPFGGDDLNPSQAVVRALDGRRIAGHPVTGRVLPCAFETALPALFAAMDEVQPTLVIALGLAASRTAVSIERVAVNLVDARIPDNAGAQPVDVPVIEGGEPAYFARLPVKAMAAALREAGLPVELSYSAGSFVCNQVFYGLLHRLRAWPAARGGFIHLPPLPDQAPRYPGCRPLALDEQVRAVQLAATVALLRQHDSPVADGRID
jgi:pyroglutamyl-peptidase